MRPATKNVHRIPALLLLIALAIAAFGGCLPEDGQSGPPNRPQSVPLYAEKPAPTRVRSNPKIEDCHTENLVKDAQPRLILVERVVDGDTIEGQTMDQKRGRLRLWGVDAPESDQPYGWQATQALSRRVNPGELMTYLDAGPDPYGRRLAVLGNEGERAVNFDLTLWGYVHHYAQYAPESDCLKAAQETARVGRHGLWAQDQGRVYPWDWRKNR